MKHPKGMTKIPTPYNPKEVNQKLWYGWFTVSMVLCLYSALSLFLLNSGEMSDLKLVSMLVFGSNLLVCAIVGINAKLGK